MSCKQIIYPGEGDLPQFRDGSKVRFHFRTLNCVNGDEKIIDDSRQYDKPMELIIGKKFKLDIWEEYVKSMRRGEVARFKATKDRLISYPIVSRQYRRYAKGITGDDESSPRGSCCAYSMTEKSGHDDLDQLSKQPCDLEFIIELIDIEENGKYEKEIWQMSESEQRLTLPILRAEGNQLYKNSDFIGAADKYAKALDIFQQLEIRELSGCEQWNQLRQERIPFMLNFSQCKLKEKQFYLVVKLCNDIIDIDKANVKAFYRRAKAHMQLGDWNKARDDFIMAKMLDNSLESICDSFLAKIVESKKNEFERDREKFGSKLFGE